jgi:hypothetical protein
LIRINAEKNSPAPFPKQETWKIRSIERRTIQVLLIFSGGSLFWQNWHFSLGIILGGAVALLNFRWLALIGKKIFLEKKPLHGIQVPIKFLAVILAVFLILMYTRIPAVAFLLGTSALVLGILWEAFYQGFRA